MKGESACSPWRTLAFPRECWLLLKASRQSNSTLLWVHNSLSLRRPYMYIIFKNVWKKLCVHEKAKSSVHTVFVLLFLQRESVVVAGHSDGTVTVYDAAAPPGRLSSSTTSGKHLLAVMQVWVPFANIWMVKVRRPINTLIKKKFFTKMFANPLWFCYPEFILILNEIPSGLALSVMCCESRIVEWRDYHTTAIFCALYTR